MCFNPIKVNYHPSYNNYRGVLIHPYNSGRTVNCGKCIECREQYIESWQIRWMEQLKVSEPNSSYMLTLTYSDENLSYVTTPDGEEKTVLNYSDVQKFIKRLRKKQDTLCKKLKLPSPKIKYHGCGEYGKNFTKRPHYHMLITNLVLDPSCVESVWGLGMVHIGDSVDASTIKYILKYTLKFTHSENKPIKKVNYFFKKLVIDPFPIDSVIDVNRIGSDCITIIPEGNILINADVLVEQKTEYRYYPINTENEYRVSEKAFVSKGIGESFLTPENVKYYQENPYATYDYYDEKKRNLVSKPLPRYYHEKIYNPIKKGDNGRNLYDEQKKPVRVYDKKDTDSYEKSPLFVKQLLVYTREQNLAKQLLEKYNYDMDLLVQSEKRKREVRKALSVNYRKKINSYQKYNNKARNLVLI